LLSFRYLVHIVEQSEAGFENLMAVKGLVITKEIISEINRIVGKLDKIYEFIQTFGTRLC
jgi:hypothetical protein